MRVEDFEAINLDDLVNGKDNTEIIEKDQVDKVKVIDLDKICKILSSKYKIFVMPK
jgi:DNA-binding Xre family transcriptional regulator